MYSVFTLPGACTQQTLGCAVSNSSCSAGLLSVRPSAPLVGGWMNPLSPLCFRRAAHPHDVAHARGWITVPHPPAHLLAVLL